MLKNEPVIKIWNEKVYFEIYLKQAKAEVVPNSSSVKVKLSIVFRV